MNTKGISYVTTKTNMIAALGEERWTAFMAKLVGEGQILQFCYYVHYSYAGRKINRFF